MTIFKNYQTASFRNITFVLDEETTEDGRKLASHDFVNSDRRFVEDLGRIPIIFHINGFVHGDGESSGFAERDALKVALNRKGIGKLIHPVYGSVDVFAEPFSVSSNMRNAGRFNFRMVFLSVNSDREPFIQPSPGVFSDTITPGQQNLLVTPPVSLTQNPNFATNSQLAAIAQSARDDAFNAAIDEMLDAVITDQSYFDTISDTYKEGLSKIRTVTESIDDAVVRGLGLTEVTRLFNDPPGFLSNPEILFSDLSKLYREVSGAGALNKWIEATEDFADLFSLGDDTKRGSDISKSYSSLVSNYQVNALINAYQAAVTTSFSTVVELEEAEGSLNALFQSVVNDPIENSIITNVNFPNLKLLMLQMRSVTKLIFSQKEQNVFKVVAFNSNNRSLLQTVYDLYGGLDNLTVVVNLNQTVNTTHPATPLEVVEEQ